ncbi:MAG TPA: WecB/TagA/CpsF family glycosyltransferase [Longimicrobium sp.]|jgi:N-acetylglucosaminyldiphosphoundecaprenol N-acetyl-beta-D-mannosaminyltransferase
MKHYDVLGVTVSAVQIPDAIGVMEEWIAAAGAPRYVTVTGMHGVTVAQNDPGFLRVLNGSGMTVADGMPLVWLGRRRGHAAMRRRVYGPELMATFCRQTGARYAHYLYGGSPEVVQKLSAVLQADFGVRVVGAYSPPFRALTADEEAEVAARIDASGADVVWVGLSTPKQERWMAAFQGRLRAPVLVGVGAAFDFLAGVKPFAPVWMQERGLEWLFRLVSEPRRLWRRYLVSGPEFVYRVLRAELGPRSTSGS